jgi:ABC-2 type transport system ATP-binding protein
MTPPAVCIENLTKNFPVPLRRQRVTAVRNLSFEVRPGEVYGLLGPNGSGKSTTLKILLGLVTPNQGRAMIFGRDSRDYHSRAAVGFLPENPYFYKFLTAAETLRFYGNVCGLRGATLNKRIDELLALVGLEEARDRRIGGFSKGMLQRIGLAQALVQDPLLVVLDEPTAGVDPAGSHQIRDLILDLKKRGKTVLLTSHLLEQVQEICDRVGIMARGEMIREGALEDLVSVKNQTEFIIENLSPEVRLQIEQLVQKSGSNLLSSRQPQRSLESVFLELTATQPHGSK